MTARRSIGWSFVLAFCLMFWFLVYAVLARAAAPANCVTNGFSGARIKLASNAASVSGFASLSLGTTTFDTDSYVSSGHFVIPVTGYYVVDAFSEWTSGTSVGYIAIVKNGSTSPPMVIQGPGVNTTTTTTGVVSLTAADTITLYQYGNGAASPGSADAGTYMTIEYVGACPVPGAGGATSLHDLTDVDDSGKSDGLALKYNGAAAKWEPALDDVSGAGGGSGIDPDAFRAGMWLLVGSLAALLPVYGLTRLVLGWGA